MTVSKYLYSLNYSQIRLMIVTNDTTLLTNRYTLKQQMFDPYFYISLSLNVGSFNIVKTNNKLY